MRGLGALFSCLSGITFLLSWTDPVVRAQTNSPKAPAIDLSQFQASEDELLQEAMGFVEVKDNSRAIALFLDLLRYHPDGQHAEEALYRVAQCYYNLGRFDEATQSLGLLYKKYPQGKWCYPGYLLQGEMLASEGTWKEALPLFDRASASELESVSLRSHYLAVMAMENLGNLSDAGKHVDALLQAGEASPYYEYALLKSGVLASEPGKNRDLKLAETRFQAVLERSKDTQMRAEAAVRAGNLAYEQKQYREAAGYFEIVRKTGAPEFWKKLAHFGLIQSYFAMGDYKAVPEVFNQVKPQFPEKVRPQVFFLVAEAYRLSDQPKEALTAYDFVLKEFPKESVAEPSLWARIIIYKSVEAPELLQETARYLAQFKNGPHLFTVQLLRADSFYDQGEFKTARPMFDSILADEAGIKGLKPEQKAGIVFRQAHCAYAMEEYQVAVSGFSAFLKEFPKHGSVPLVLWMKGLAETALKQPEQALASWDELLSRYPKFGQRDQALWQSALLAGSLKKYDRMESYLKTYEKEFGAKLQSARLAETQYWLALCRQEMKDDRGAVPYWEKARELDGAAYYGEATRQIIRIILDQKNSGRLKKEVDDYDAWRASRPKEPAVALEVYEWLGQEIMDGKKPEEAEPYLRRVLAASKDKGQLKRSQLRVALLMFQLKRWGAAVREWQAYRVNYPDEANRSPVLEPLAQAHIGAADFDAAEKLAEQILKQNPEGEYNARGRLLLGDVQMGKHNYKEAGKFYSAVALLVEDKELTPLALTRAEEAYRAAGDGKKADELLLRLKKEYPEYKGE